MSRCFSFLSTLVRSRCFANKMRSWYLRFCDCIVWQSLQQSRTELVFVAHLDTRVLQHRWLACDDQVYPRGRAGQGGPAAAWYFVYILYYILDIFGYVQFGHPSARRSETLIGRCHMYISNSTMRKYTSLEIKSCHLDHLHGRVKLSGPYV